MGKASSLPIILERNSNDYELTTICDEILNTSLDHSTSSALKIMAGQRSLTVITGFLSAEKHR